MAKNELYIVTTSGKDEGKLAESPIHMSCSVIPEHLVSVANSIESDALRFAWWKMGAAYTDEGVAIYPQIFGGKIRSATKPKAKMGQLKWFGSNDVDAVIQTSAARSGQMIFPWAILADLAEALISAEQGVSGENKHWLWSEEGDGVRKGEVALVQKNGGADAYLSQGRIQLFKKLIYAGDPMLSQKDAADKMEISNPAMSALVSRGELVAYMAGENFTQIPETAVNHWILAQG